MKNIFTRECIFHVNKLRELAHGFFVRTDSNSLERDRENGKSSSKAEGPGKSQGREEDRQEAGEEDRGPSQKGGLSRIHRAPGWATRYTDGGLSSSALDVSRPVVARCATGLSFFKDELVLKPTREMADSLDVVAVGVERERSIVIGVIFGPQSG